MGIIDHAEAVRLAVTLGTPGEPVDVTIGRATALYKFGRPAQTSASSNVALLKLELDSGEFEAAVGRVTRKLERLGRVPR